MKVILIPSSVDLVGVSTHVYELAKLLRDAGLLDSVICPRDGWLSEALEDDGIPYFVMDISFKPRRYVSSNWRLSRFLVSRRSASIVHVHGRFPLVVCAASLLACRHLTFVATIHQFGFNGLRKAWDWKQSLEAVMLRRMKRICCVSEDLRNELLSRTGISPEGVEVIPNWIEPLWVGREAERSNLWETRRSMDGTRICGVGRLSREKGFDILLESIGILKKEGYRVSADIFGDGPEKEWLLCLARQLGVEREVSLNKSWPDVRSVLPTYHALAIPSRSESFGIVALEAYDAYLPVVASDVPGLRNTVLHNQTGLLFESGNPQALAAAIKMLICSENLASNLTANGRKFLENYLPNEAVKRKYIEFYANARQETTRRQSALTLAVK